MQQLRVIKGKKGNTSYCEIYCRVFLDELSKYNGTEDKEILKKISYYGVKLVNEISREELNYEQIMELFELIEAIKVALSFLTPNELIRIFPIEKKYDGRKYQIKDYFFTMQELKDIGMDNLIMTKIDELLWNYMNYDISRFTVNATCVLSDLAKLETGKGLMEIFAEENGIDTYKICKDKTTGKQYIYNPKTCKSTAIRKSIPQYLKIIK